MKRFVKIAISSVLLSAAVVAYAGSRSHVFVQVDTVNRYAFGAMTDARGSSDPYQQINCYTGTGIAGCLFVNAAGVAGSCYTFNPALIEQIRSISGESYVNISWNPDNTCSYITIQNMSWGKSAAVSGF
jgi:hypothetical protein